MNRNVKEQAQHIYKILDAKKLKSIEALDVHELTTLADIFIIAVTNNNRATRALADELEYKLEQEDIKVIQKEGYQSANWILMDYGDVIVHILVNEDAEFYDLGHLWQDAKTLIF